jgi:hypothetical protein
MTLFLLIYALITFLVYMVYIFFAYPLFSDYDFPEIENPYDLLFYGLLWPLVFLKYLCKFLVKLSKK